MGDVQAIDQPRLGIDPVFDRDHREVGAVRFARRGVGMHRPGRAKAGAGVVDTDDEEPVRIERLAGTDQVVPPTEIAVGIQAGDMV